MMETGGLEDVPLWNATHKVTEHLVPACSEEEHVIQYMSSSESFNLPLDLDLYIKIDCLTSSESFNLPLYLPLHLDLSLYIYM